MDGMSYFDLCLSQPRASRGDGEPADAPKHGARYWIGLVDGKSLSVAATGLGTGASAADGTHDRCRGL
jgi:hypothetical protein